MGGKAALGLLGLAVGFLVGYGTGRVSTGTPINPLSDQKGGYEAGYQAAAQKAADAGILPPAQETALGLDGTVMAVGDDRLTIEADLRSFDPLGLKNLPKERVVTITSSTTIVRLEAKSAEEFEADQRAFNEALADYRPDAEGATLPPAPPSNYTETKISLADIRVGDLVTVIAAADILSSASFEAVNVVVLPASPAGEASANSAAPPAGAQGQPDTSSGTPSPGTPQAGEQGQPDTSDGAPAPGTPPPPSL